MTYYDLMMSANRKLDNGDITLGEYEEMIEPFKREIEPERKTGLWMDPEQGICWCSICGCRAEEVSNYCPDCGAQMRPNWKYKGEAQ